MKLRISGTNKDQHRGFLNGAKDFLDKTQAPLRLSKVIEKKESQKVLYLRERTWPEFFLEKLILTPQEMEDVQNETLAAIEFAFFPLADESKGQVGNQPRANEKDDLRCLDDSDNLMQPNNSNAGNDETMSADENAGLWKDRLRSKVFGKHKSEIEAEPEKPGHVRTFNGLLTVPKGISVSTCSALQVIAHHVIVGSVGAMSLPRVDPYSPLKRASEAFESAWAARKKTLNNGLAFETPIGPNSDYIFIRHTLDLKPGLKHIQDLQCIPDRAERDYRNDFFGNKDKDFWKKFYMQALKPLEGSIVCELYPDGYSELLNERGERTPFCSRPNLYGALNAARHIRKEKSANGQEPPSIMFICPEGDWENMSKFLPLLSNSELSDDVILDNGYGIMKNGRPVFKRGNDSSS